MRFRGFYYYLGSEIFSEDTTQKNNKLRMLEESPSYILD